MENTRYLTGCKILDMVVGGAKGVYGFPAGKFINIVGDKSSGKTFLSNEILAWAYHNFDTKKFKWVYDDCESGYSFDTKSMYGFDVIPDDEEDIVRSTTVEEAFCNISNFCDSLKKDQCGIYVLDSLDSLTSSEQDERAEERLKAFNNDKTFDKGSYGMGKQKYLSQEFFPQLCSKVQDKNILVIIVSQVRENVDMFSFEKFTRSGGKAMDFYAHTVLWLATCQKIIKKDRSIGVVVKAKVTKSKTPRPFRECFFSFLYDYGLDSIGSSVDYLYDLRTPKGDLTTKAKALQWGETDLNFDKLKEFLEDHDLTTKYEESKHFDGKYEAETMFDFIQSKKAYKDAYAESFGSSMSREELILWIEDNDKVDDLEERVESKWEDIEDSIKSNRRKKYGTVPEGGLL